MSISGAVTFALGLVLIIGIGVTYRSNQINDPLVKKATNAAMSDMANANASLPKWDDRNYKGLVHRAAK